MENAGGIHAWRPRLRVLCLHGRCQTAATFELKLERLATKAASYAEFVFVDGPVELPLQHGERVNTRGWWPADAERCLSDAQGPVEEVLARAWQELGPFDGVLGFSEGALAALRFCYLAAAAGSAPEGAVGRGLEFAIFAGAPAPTKGPKLSVPSLHFASKEDTVVPIADSRRFAQLFEEAEFRQHDGGHCAPQRAEDVRRVAAFLDHQRNRIMPPAASAGDPSGFAEDPLIGQDQADEIEALLAMYPEEELRRIHPAWPVRLAARLNTEGLAGQAAGASLHFTLPPAYPHAASCRCVLETSNMDLMAHERELLEAVEAARMPLGSPSVMDMVQGAQHWIDEHIAGLAARSNEAGTAKADGDDGEDDQAAQSDAWWLKDEEEMVDEAMLTAAERKAAKLLPDSMEGAGAWARECGASAYGKPWDFVVGLVGKPSAGKSTLFNAATRPDSVDKEAAMAPHPFTTIDPNVGAGWFAAPCPAESLQLADTAQPEHGKLSGRRRKHPLLIKDVAGLVPGAYLGRGRGNAFLNDLCEADSLVHVVDASGRSDKDGVDQGAPDERSAGSGSANASSPTSIPEEVAWVRREIHLWIFCNVRAKWETVRKKARMATTHVAREAVADRLFALFTGYHASAQLAAQVFEAAGFNLSSLPETVYAWREEDLHLMVACFLRARFPITVALNKIDVPAAAERVAQAQEMLGPTCVPVSARSEWWLWDQQRQGHLTFAEGGAADSVVIAPSAPATVAQQWSRMQARVFEPYGVTGVMEVLSRAVYRRRPIFACPVADFSSFEGLQRAASAGAGAAGPAPAVQPAHAAHARAAAPLSSMVMLRPLSTVEEAFQALKHEHMLRGDFVRAEVLLDDDAGRSGAAQAPSVRVLKRTDALAAAKTAASLPPSALVIKVATNKKLK